MRLSHRDVLAVFPVSPSRGLGGPQEVPLHFQSGHLVPQKIAFKLFVWLETGFAFQAGPREAHGTLGPGGKGREWGQAASRHHQTSGSPSCLS